MRIDITKSCLLLILVIPILISCSLERKIASKYIKNKDKISIVLTFPKYIVKTNLNTNSLQDKEFLSDDVIDSLLYFKSQYLQNIIDSVFLKYAENNFIKEMVLYGIKVYNPDDYKKINNTGKRIYFFKLAQIQLEETTQEIVPKDLGYKLDKVQRSKSIDYVSSMKQIRVNSINVNSWYELSKADSTEIYPMLFSSYYVTDNVDGWYDYDFDNPAFQNGAFRFNIQPMSQFDLYEFLALTARHNAINLYDYMLNHHIQNNLPKGKIPNAYYHYDRENKLLTKFNKDCFAEIDP
ncbi:MAG: hypothetical protein CVU00_07845 [Bacteroidetes bacterium HGW-Bacteroidetes-17]|jgi:hypothetical protein|nr:MAG: hypothetical protein CVU00_07845 [Bacteroidetes bacterium HGW-Bacteroidetes-17]